MGFLKDFWDAGPFSSGGGSKEEGGWRPSDPHPSKSMGGQTHFDVEKYDKSGHKDKSAGKLHISGEPHKPSMRDVYPPSKK